MFLCSRIPFSYISITWKCHLRLVPGTTPVSSSPDNRRQAGWGEVLPRPILLHLLLAVGISHIIIISWPFKTYGPFDT